MDNYCCSSDCTVCDIEMWIKVNSGNSGNIVKSNLQKIMQLRKKQYMQIMYL